MNLQPIWPSRFSSSLCGGALILGLTACADTMGPGGPERAAPAVSPALGTSVAAMALYGPERFTRLAGAPQTFERTLSTDGFDPPYHLIVRRGGEAGGPGGTRLLAATVRLDGRTVFGPGAAASGEGEWSEEVELGSTAQLSVTLAGPPGGFVEIEVTGIPRPVSSAAVIATGSQAQTSHFCALRSDGAALCWGSNQFGQLGIGDSTTTFSAEPVPVAGGHVFSSLGVGANHTCGLRDDGVVLCWGNNVQAQLGAGTGPHRFEPGPISSALSFVSLAAQGNTTCALDEGGGAHCWGNNGTGQVGNGSVGGVVPHPAPVVGGHAFSGVAAGTGHVCALTGAGEAWCWGSNAQGQFGTGALGSAHGSPQRAAEGHTFRSLSAAFLGTCGVDTQGRGWCWGSEIVDGALVGTPSPAEVPGDLTFRHIELGDGVACGIATDGRLHCWGRNDSGQLGTGDFTDSSAPALAAGGDAYAAVAVNATTVCGIRTDGAARCWGAARSGLLGDGRFDHAWPTPRAVAGGHLFASVVSAYQASCGLTAAGEAFCWGLGYGHEPVHVPAAVSFVEITAGDNHFCALTGAGAAYCWGQNQAGQLGDGTTTSRFAPAPVVGGHTFRELRAGLSGACGLGLDDRLHCWGPNYWGRYGNGEANDPSPRPTPTLAAGGKTFSSVSALNLTHMCGIDPGGESWCWGTTVAVGDGSSGSLVPVRVSGGHAFSALFVSATNNTYSCALTAAGEAFCWGSNAAGTLGDGTTTNRSLPAPVSGGHTFAGLAVAFGMVCGIESGGTTRCWGTPSGRLGAEGAEPRYLEPVLAAGGKAFQSLSMGIWHACGVAVSGGTFCWGGNSAGELGGLGPFLSAEPVAVLGGHQFASDAG